MTVFYNEHDPFAAQWLRELCKEGLIAPGEVDESDVQDLLPAELVRYTQCHFFAGIGVWSYALRLAGWPDDRSVWTGSCPCQPFSSAGRREGFADERHVWSYWFWLIGQCRPNVIFGEQVGSKDGMSWFDLVANDLESAGYTVGAVVFPACSVGAPHLRQRLYWVAESSESRRGGRWAGKKMSQPGEVKRSERFCITDELGDVGIERCEECEIQLRQSEQSGKAVFDLSTTGGASGSDGQPPTGPVTDGKWRATESGIQPLAHGVAARMAKLRGIGNAIVAEQAKVFLEAYLESRK